MKISTIGRELVRDRLPAMPAIGEEVGAIHSPHFAPFVQFRHSHDASIGQVHRPVGVLRNQGQHTRHLLCEIEIQEQIPTRNQRQDRAGIGKKAAGFGHHRVTGEEGTVPPESLRCPVMARVIGSQQSNDHAGISDWFHAWSRSADSGSPLLAGSLQTRPLAEKPPPGPPMQSDPATGPLNLPGHVRSSCGRSPHDPNRAEPRALQPWPAVLAQSLPLTLLTYVNEYTPSSKL